jgi:hypothetical protein
MPVDLDDLYASLARQAESVPLGGADSARRRGRQRRRHRAMVAVAAAVCLVAGGVAAVVVRPEPRPALPADRTSLTEVGSPRPIGPPAPAEPTNSVTMLVDGVAYTGWQEAGGEVKISGIDLHTGRATWPTRSLGRAAAFETIVAVRGTLLVKVHLNAANPYPVTYAFDTATGAPRPYSPVPTEQTLVYGGNTLIGLVGGTGRVWAADAATGRIHWDETNRNAPVDRTVGMTLTAAGDDNRPPQARVTYFSGNRIVQADRKGHLMIRDADTGRLLDTRSVGTSAPELLIVHDGRIYSAQRAAPYRIQVIDLDGGPGGVITGPAGRPLQDLQPCGADRVCVLERADDSSSTWVAMYDGGTRRRLWQVAGPRSATSMEARQGRILVEGVVLDAAGRVIFRAEPAGRRYRWLDAEHLVGVPFPFSGPVALVTLRTGEVRELGHLERAISDFCAPVPERLFCYNNGSLRLWDISG